MLWIAHKREDIPLRYAQVLKEVPGRIGHVGRSRVHVCAWKIGDRFIEGHVCLATLKQRSQLLTQECI